MGGNAFPGLDLVRIHRDNVPAMVRHIVNQLDYPGFTVDYATRALMGSTGKKETSGDIDFCFNTYTARFPGEEDLPIFDKHDVLKRVRQILPNEQVNTKTLKMGNLMMAWPLLGNQDNGFVQVDFVFGRFDLLQFTHYSPGDESEFKGVFVSQALGILAKMKKDFEARDPVTNERTGRVGLHLSLEQGLYRQWEARRRPGMGCSKCDPDYFETRFPECPRFRRIGYIQEPSAILEAIFGKKVKHEEVNTFEKIVEYVRINMPERYGEFWERFCYSAGGSSIAKQNSYNIFEVATHPIWRAKEFQNISSNLKE